jgi:hypothetical protein
MNKKMSFASVAMILMMAVMGLTSTGFADQRLELKARQNRRINGFQVELRGDYREGAVPIASTAN